VTNVISVGGNTAYPFRASLRHSPRYLGAAALCLAASVTAAADEQAEHARSTASVSIGAPIAHEYVDDEAGVAEDRDARLPHNVTIFWYEIPLASMLRRSPTFRRQCARIAAAPQLQVSVVPSIVPGDSDRTLTRLAFNRNGSVQARVTVGPERNPVESLAHEFEHILEQLDGVDLVSMAHRRATGVYATPGGERFETERALAAGRQVAREVLAHRGRGGQ